MSELQARTITPEENKKYLDSLHRIGRWGSLISVLIMVGIPILVCLYYNCMPNFGLILQAGVSLLMVFGPIAISEVISYAPILGSASYITFITGEVLNIKLPAGINALKVANVESGTEEGDVIVTVAVCVCSLFAMAVMIVGVLLLVPLKPFFELAAVKTATSYMLPALFGSLSLGIFASSGAGKYAVKGKFWAAVPAMLFTAILIVLLGKSVSNYQGFILLVMIPVTIWASWIMYQKKVIKVYESGKPEPLAPQPRKKKQK